MADKISIVVNGKAVEVRKGVRLLEAVREGGATVPTLCRHKDLMPLGSCRLCMCEIEQDGKRQLVTACDFVVEGPLSVQTESPDVVRHRRTLAELYLRRWPNVAAVKAIARRTGVTSSRMSGQFEETDSSSCILCGRCTAACEEFVLERIIGFAGRGMERHVAMPFHQVDSHCIGCTSCAHVCPTGAIEIIDDLNRPADPRKIQSAGMKVNAELATLDTQQCRMREMGTLNILQVMDKYDLLPVHNFQYGSHVDARKIYGTVFRDRYLTQGQADGCWPGCSMACAKTADGFELKSGPYKGQRVTVDGPEYETGGGCANMGCFDPHFVLEFNFYCDTYGVDTISMSTVIAFVMEAFEAGVITPEDTGGLELRFGACDESLELLHQMARGKGFGVLVGQGVRWLKERWIEEGRGDPQFLRDIGMEAKGLEYSQYVSKESLAQQCGYTMAIKGPQHDEAWLIFMDMVNNQLPTFELKAEALYYFPLWRTWFGLMGLCKLLWNDVVPADNYREKEPHKIPGHVRNYFKYFEGMTGKELDEQKMLDQSARVYNLQRCMSYRFGKGTREHDLPPYRAVGPVTVREYESRAERYDKQLRELLGIDPTGLTTQEKMAKLRAHREEQYSKTMEVVYRRRGWNRNGVPTLARLRELGIDLPEIVALVADGQEPEA